MKLSHFVPAAERHSGPWIIHAGHRHLPRSQREKPLLTTEGVGGAEREEEDDEEEEEELLPHHHFEKNRWHFGFTDGPNGTFYRPDLKATFPSSAVRVDHFLKKYIRKWLTDDLRISSLFAPLKCCSEVAENNSIQTDYTSMFDLQKNFVDVQVVL